MFTSKISELVNNSFESIQPLVCLDSIYYECASTNDNRQFKIDRQTVYKHLTSLVNKNISKQTQSYEAGNSSKYEGEEDTILATSPLMLSTYNASYVQLSSKWQYNLNEILYNYVVDSSFNESYIDTSKYIYEYLKNTYEGDIEKLQERVGDLSTFTEQLYEDLKDIIDTNFIPRDEYNLQLVDECNNLDASVIINASSCNQYINKNILLQFATQIREFLNTAPEKWRYEAVYPWEVFEGLVNLAYLYPNKTYNILYYPRTKNFGNAVYEHNKFSMPIILEVLAIDECHISPQIKVKNAIDTLTQFAKNTYNDVSTYDVVDVVNVYNFQIADKTDLVTSQYYTLKPIYLMSAMPSQNKIAIIFYDDLYGYIINDDGTLKYYKNSGGTILCEDILRGTHKCCIAYVLTIILLYILQNLCKDITLLMDEDTSFINKIIKNSENISLAIKSMKSLSADTVINALMACLKSKEDKFNYFFDLSSTTNIFRTLLVEKLDIYENFVTDINDYITNMRSYYYADLYDFFDGVSTTLTPVNNRVCIDTKYMIYNYLHGNKAEIINSDFYKYLNIYYDTYNGIDASYGLLYNGCEDLYEKIKNETNLNNNWILKNNAYSKHYEVLQGGKIVPYEKWVAKINGNDQSIIYLKDDKNNIGDYDFRSLPTYTTQHINANTSIFADDLFWQTFYQMAIYDDDKKDLFDVSTTFIERYAQFSTKNNKILYNKSNTDRLYSYYVSIPANNINKKNLNSVYLGYSNTDKKTINTENIEIVNNNFDYLVSETLINKQLEYIIAGTNFKFIGNTIQNTWNEGNNELILYAMKDSNVLNSSINCYVGYEKNNATLVNTTIANASISTVGDDAFQNSEILSSEIYLDQYQNYKFSSVINCNNPNIPNKVNLQFSSLYGSNAQSIVNEKIPYDEETNVVSQVVCIDGSIYLNNRYIFE